MVILVRTLVLYSPQNVTPNGESVRPPQLRSMKAALESEPNETCLVRTYDPSTVSRLMSAHKPDLVFNLVYGYVSGRYQEAQPDSAARLETFGVPIAGSSAAAQRYAQDKRLTAAVLARSGLTAPREISPRFLSTRTTGVIKPRFGALHNNVEVVRSPHEFRRLRDQIDEECILQEYVHGAEFTVAVLEIRNRLIALPAIEVRFDSRSARMAHVMNWKEFRWKNVIRDDVTDLVRNTVFRAFLALGLRHYARFDLRVNPAGIVILDANALPNLDPERSMLPKAAAAAGISYERLIRIIASSAILHA
jgi:D-alanine-D-alanine ligase